MNSPIYKTFYGKYIDLDRLIAISEASFVDRMGHGGYYVSFNMVFQLVENPIVYTRGLTSEEYSTNIHEDEHGSRRRNNVLHRGENNKLLCEINLDNQIQEILTAWENWKKYRSPNGINNVSFTS